MQVKATLTPKTGAPVILTFDWNETRAVREFAKLADICLRHGGKVLTENA